MCRCARFVLIIALPVTAACGKTSYTPAKSPRVSVTSDGFVRDGMTYPTGLGGGLVDALHDSPRAQSEARTARSFAIGGFVCSIGGLTLEGVGLGMMVAGSERDDATGM